MIKHLSSKFKLNELADQHSHNPATSDTVNCSIHRFISETDSVIDNAAKCASLTNRQAWL